VRLAWVARLLADGRAETVGVHTVDELAAIARGRRVRLKDIEGVGCSECCAVYRTTDRQLYPLGHWPRCECENEHVQFLVRGQVR